MLSLPDFKEKQLLLIRAERGVSCGIRFQNDNIVFEKNGAATNRASCHKVFAVFIMGDISITSGLLKESRRHGVSLFFLKYNFESYASVNAAAEGHYLLRIRQYEIKEVKELAMAKMIIKNKIRNQCALLRERKLTGGLAGEEDGVIKAVEAAANADSIRGVEGNSSRRFFEEYFASIGWFRRIPRAKEDISNLLLDIGYSMLFNCADSLLRLFGFDTYKGFFHKLFFQRKSLACDLMEPLRCLIDRELLKMHNLKQIKKSDFKVKNGKYMISFEKSRKYAEIFMEAVMNRKEDIYEFTRGFYSFVMNEDAREFPDFKIK